MKHQSLKQRYSTQFTGEWEWIPTVNEYEGPSARCGHTLTVHGKIFDSSSPNHTNNNNDNDNNNSEKQQTNNLHGKLLVTFGESSLLASREYLDDMYLLDLSTLKWVKILGKNILNEYKPYIKSNFNPVARADHAAVSFGQNGDRCLIFGGKCKDTYLDDLIVVKNISSFPCSETMNNNLLKIESIHLPKGPCGRRGSSLCPWKEGSFLLFGGQRGSLFFNDLWGLDLHKQGWVELATRRNPMQRAFHSAFVDSQQQMLLLGGVRDTQANPAPADIFKLDLRAGKFFKLGDKDMVPGISNALSKGHHSSHFLSKNCDLIIFAPQKASTHLLGGNVTSEHCGRCTQIKVINPSGSAAENDNNKPSGTCRPATALLESHKSLKEFKCLGCNNRPLERLFIFGGYSPSKRICTNQLYSLKFSSQPCKILNHKCLFTSTPIFKDTNKENTLNKENSNLSPSTHTIGNRAFCDVTPMRAENSLKKKGDSSKESKQLKNSSNTSKKKENYDDIRCTPSVRKRKRVSIVQTPVRAKSLPVHMFESATFAMFDSEAANHKIAGLDPEIRGDTIDGVDDDDIHWQFIERILLNFDESLLDPDASFLLEPHEIIRIIHRALPLIQADATLIRIDGPVKIFGDIHGQLGDLMSLFKSFGYPDVNIGDISFYKYIFLGDFVDRGHKSLEIIILLLSLKIQYPERVFLIRGNHECHAMNEMYGFYHEINDRLYPNINTIKYLDNGQLNTNLPQDIDIEIDINRKHNHDDDHDGFTLDIDLQYDEFEVSDEDTISCELTFDDEDDDDDASHKKNRKHGKKKVKRVYKSRKYFENRADCLNYLVQSFELLFRWLSLGILISDRILCIHGGIGEIERITDIESIERPCDVVCDIQQEMDDQQKKVVDLLWSDPAEKDCDTGFQPNKRGVSCVFGSDIVRRFCKVNDIDLIIRGHQVVKDGFEYFAGGHLITVFSATNYCNVMDNAGAILCIDDKLRVLPKLVEPRQVSGMQGNDGHHHNNSRAHEEEEEEEEDEDEDDQDNLQWRKLKQFPPSPMRNSGDGVDGQVGKEDHNEIQLTFDDITTNNDKELSQSDEKQMSDNQFFNTLPQPISSFK